MVILIFICIKGGNHNDEGQDILPGWKRMEVDFDSDNILETSESVLEMEKIDKSSINESEEADVEKPAASKLIDVKD
jgi:hypothetical protein